MHLYTVISVFIKYYPDDDPSGSKHIAVKITKNKAVLMVFFINQFEDHWPSVPGRTNACNQNYAGYF